MNGSFKFDEGLFLKYKKEISLAVGSILVFATVVNFVPGSEGSSFGGGIDRAASRAVEENVENNCYAVLIDGEPVGHIDYFELADSAYEEATRLLVEDLGYDPEQEPAMKLVDDYSLLEDYMTVDELAVAIKDSIKSHLSNPKELAYVMKIGDSFTVAVKTEEDIKEVLKRAQSLYVSEDTTIEVDLGEDDRNSLIMTPTVTMSKAPSEVRNFTTSISEGTTVGIELAADVLVIRDFVRSGDIKDLETATELVTKEHEEATMYEIEKGDVLGMIAQEHGMSLKELYALNPGLEARATKIQIGEPITVMQPESDLKVQTMEELVYTKPINRETVYTKNPDKYIGSESVVDYGSDGVMQITAMVTKLNGEEVDREITDETVLTEPTNKVISKGTKPLPVKGATGNFVYPLEDFRITSSFGPRWGSYHTGVDMAAPYGTQVHAADGGTVIFAGWKSSYGYCIDIDHGKGTVTRYAHNSSLLVKVGQAVAKYEVIAKVGSTGHSTGPHVHFEIRFDDVPVNPMKYLP